MARVLTRAHLGGPRSDSPRACGGAPSSRVAASLGWHLGEVAGPASRVARLPGGGRLLVDVRDYAHRQIFLTGIYEEGVTRLMRRLARPGWSVVDVGANAGYHTFLATGLGAPGARVLALEPSPRMRELLVRSVALNPGARVEVIAAACADRDGPLSFRMSPDPRTTGISTTHEGPPRDGEVQVAGVRLDALCAERGITPELVKIDVEGAEAGVLRGATGLLARRPPAHVICELWPATRDEVVALMAAHGYTAHGIATDGSLTDEPVASPAAGPAGWADACFRHEAAIAR